MQTTLYGFALVPAAVPVPSSGPNFYSYHTCLPLPLLNGPRSYKRFGCIMLLQLFCTAARTEIDQRFIKRPASVFAARERVPLFDESVLAAFHYLDLTFTPTLRLARIVSKYFGRQCAQSFHFGSDRLTGIGPFTKNTQCLGSWECDIWTRFLLCHQFSCTLSVLFTISIVDRLYWGVFFHIALIFSTYPAGFSSYQHSNSKDCKESCAFSTTRNQPYVSLLMVLIFFPQYSHSTTGAALYEPQFASQSHGLEDDNRRQTSYEKLLQSIAKFSCCSQVRPTNSRHVGVLKSNKNCLWWAEIECFRALLDASAARHH